MQQRSVIGGAFFVLAYLLLIQLGGSGVTSRPSEPLQFAQQTQSRQKLEALLKKDSQKEKTKDTTAAATTTSESKSESKSTMPSNGDVSPRNDNAGFSEALRTSFPGTQRQNTFLDSMDAALAKRGFNADNTIACIGVCRDEICSGMMNELEKRYGECFNLRGLAGFLFCGKTGLGAAHAHSPEVEGRERYVYVVAPHIGIMGDGTIGQVMRPGREKASHACGALCAIEGMLASGKLDLSLDMNDIEMSLIKQILVAELGVGKVPTLTDITKASADVIRRQLESAISLTVRPQNADYSVICGIQIHGPGLGQNYFMPMHDHCYTVVDGKREQLNLDA